MKSTKHHENGQAIVLLAFAFIGLIGFAALAIDGGMIYSDRRHAQNASDAASLAGGGQAALSLENNHIFYSSFNCNNLATQKAVAQTAAENFAVVNGYSTNDILVTFDCNDTGSGISTDKYLDVTTTISKTTQTALAHFVYEGDVSQTVQATTRVRPRQPLVFGNAVVALNPAACQGQQNGAGFHGNATIHVKGGGIFSNGCVRVNGGPTVDATQGGHVSYGGNFSGDPTDTDPDAQYVDFQIPPSAYDVPEPTSADCAGRWYNSLSGNLSPGLYCMTGNLRLNSGTLTGDGVTIYVPIGEVRINGNVTIQLTAPVEVPDPSPAIPGILFYLPASNHEEIKINGNSDSYFQGTVLAPGADCDMLGNGATDAYRTQMICWNVEVGGTADTYVLYDDTNQYSKPTWLDLQE
jgi:hypothetical protein